MKKLRWQLITIFLAGLVVGILLLSDTTTGPMQIFDSQPAGGGIYREGLVGNIQRLNPLLSWYNDVDRDVCSLIYSSLVTHDTRGNIVKDLAVDYGISMDGMTYNFAINPEAKWHDGQPVTADDVIFTYETLKKGEGYLPTDLISFWQNVQINPVDQHTVQFVLQEAFSPFMDYLSFGILPRHVFSGMSFSEMADSKINIQPIGSGPFRLKSLIQDGDTITGLELEANRQYYGKKPYLDEVDFLYYEDSTLAYQAYQQDLIDGISYISNDILKPVLADVTMSLYTTRLPIMSMVFFNLDNKDVAFFQDQKVRSALMQGLNRNKIANNILEGQAIIAHSPILYGNWAYFSEIPHIEYDTYKAVETLKMAGFTLANEQDRVRSKDGITLNFTMLYPDDETHRKIAESIAADWAQINVLVNLEAVPYQDLTNIRLADRDYQAALVDINLSDFPDPDPYPFWDQTQISSGQNFTQWNDRTISQYLETARVEIDHAERERLYKNFQILFMEQLPALPLYTPVYNYPVTSKVSGISIGPLYSTSDRFLNITDWYMVSRTSAMNEEISEESELTEQ